MVHYPNPSDYAEKEVSNRVSNALDDSILSFTVIIESFFELVHHSDYF